MATSSNASQPTAPGEVQVRRALLSVSDKRGLVDFARGLTELGVEIVSTGGTAAELEGEGVPSARWRSYTGFPEILDGRVKTLHPRIHARPARGSLERGARGHPERARDRADRPGVREPLSFERVSSKRGVDRRR